MILQIKYFLIDTYQSSEIDVEDVLSLVVDFSLHLLLGQLPWHTWATWHFEGVTISMFSEEAILGP